MAAPQGLSTAQAAWLLETAGPNTVPLQRTKLAVRLLRTMIPAPSLVPGDAVHLRVGDFVPADVVVQHGTMTVDQSTLTGESAPVNREPGSTVYAGATGVRGEASGTVAATGAATYFGKTAELVGSSAPAAHLEYVVLRIVRVFSAVDLVLAVAGTAGLAAAGFTSTDVIS